MAKRPSKKAPEDGGDPSVVLFTALGLILVAFFIMLNNIAVIDEDNAQKALDSIHQTFGVFPGAHPAADARNPAQLRSQEVYDAEMEARLLELMMSERHPGMDVERREDGRIAVVLDNDVVFESGQRRLSPRIFGALDTVATMIGNYQSPVAIEGHTDPSSGRSSNWYLSASRASAVQRYLEEAANVPRQYVSAAGYADSRYDPESEHSGRRVEIVFEPRGQ